MMRNMLSLLTATLAILSCQPVFAVPQAVTTTTTATASATSTSVSEASSTSVSTTTATESATSTSVSVATSSPPSSTVVETTSVTSTSVSVASTATETASVTSTSVIVSTSSPAPSTATETTSVISTSVSVSTSSLAPSIATSTTSVISTTVSVASSAATSSSVPSSSVPSSSVPSSSAPSSSAPPSSAPSSSASSTSSIAPPPTPTGGLGTSPTDVPQYVPLSDYDLQSLNLALQQEYLELDLFHNGLARFSPEEFEAAGITPEQQFLIEYMADQEVGHAQMITNILGPNNASKSCTYAYPFDNVRDFIDFSSKMTRIGESGVLGFLAHLNSQAVASLLAESITVESRQEMVLRQMEGLFPMPQFFNPVITQSMQWTQITPWILSCPSTNPKIEWQNFPGLNITNAPNASAITNDTLSAVSHNRSTPLSQSGQLLHLQWEAPGKQVGPGLNYTTTSSAGTPLFAAWISQLNVTYTPLINVTNFTAYTRQPGGAIYGNDTASLVNGTVFVLVTDAVPVVTSYNLSLLDSHVVAGPAAYTAG